MVKTVRSAFLLGIFYSCLSFSMQQPIVSVESISSASVPAHSGSQDTLAQSDGEVFLPDQFDDALLHTCVCDFIKEKQPSFDVETVPNLSSLLRYRFPDGSTILHQLLFGGFGSQVLVLVREIVKRDVDIVFVLNKNGQSCFWECFDPLILDFLLYKMSKISIARCCFLIEARNKEGLSYIDHLMMSFKHIPCYRKNIIDCICCLIRHAYATNNSRRLLLVKEAAQRTQNNFIFAFCDKIIFFRQCIESHHKVKTMRDMGAMRFRSDPLIFNSERMLLAQMPGDTLFTQALVEKAYPLSGKSCQEYVSFLKMVISFIDNVDILTEFSFQGTTLLHRAVFHNDFDMVCLLLRKGVSGNCIDALHNTPLHVALLHKNTVMAKRLKKYTDIFESKNVCGLSCFAIMQKDFPQLLTGKNSYTSKIQEVGGRITYNEYDVYEKIAYMPYSVIEEFLEDSVSKCNRQLVLEVRENIAKYREMSNDGMPLVSLIVKKYCQEPDNLNHKRLLDILFSTNFFSNTLFLESLQERSHPFFIALEHKNCLVIEYMLKACPQLQYCHIGFAREVPINRVMRLYKGTGDRSWVPVIRLLLDFGLSFSCIPEDLLQFAYHDDGLAPIFYFYKIDIFMKIIAKQLGSSHSSPFICVPIGNLRIYGNSIGSHVYMDWSSQRLIVICALYYMKMLGHFEPAFYDSFDGSDRYHSLECLFLCMMFIVNEMHNDFIDGHCIQRYFPDLSKEDVKCLYGVKSTILEHLLRCDLSTQDIAGVDQDDIWTLQPTPLQLNTFFMHSNNS